MIYGFTTDGKFFPQGRAIFPEVELEVYLNGRWSSYLYGSPCRSHVWITPVGIWLVGLPSGVIKRGNGKCAIYG